LGKTNRREEAEMGTYRFTKGKGLEKVKTGTKEKGLKTKGGSK